MKTRSEVRWPLKHFLQTTGDKTLRKKLPEQQLAKIRYAEADQPHK
jgi:hypothetical protein